MFTPLKIIFEMDTPMVPPSGYPLHLDALLAYAITQQHLGEMAQGFKTPVPDMRLRELAHNLPLEKSGDEGDNWVWKASALIPVEMGDHAIRLWTRKTDPYDYAERVKDGRMEISTSSKNALEQGKKYAHAIDTVRGILKNYFQFYQVASIRKMEAWCVGGRDAIEELLAPESGLLTHLGKRSRIGHGRIRSVTVEPCPDAVEQWKQRVLPWQEKGYLPVQAAFRPPYWASENRQTAYCPPVILG